jgi:uncharacterized protein YeaC (DUF1315 family)
MNLAQLISSITPELYESLKTAIELGKWDDGKRLDKDQVALCMEAVLRYEAEFVAEESRVGYMESECKSTKKAPDIIIQS